MILPILYVLWLEERANFQQSRVFGQNFSFPEGGIDGGDTDNTGGQHFEEGDDDDLYN